MTERRRLRVISVHGVAGGSGCSTVALLLADFFAQGNKALLVELDPRKASLADALMLQAPTWDDPGIGMLVSAGPDRYDSLLATRQRLTDLDAFLPDLSATLEHEDAPIDPHALGWHLSDGNAGSGRVFVVPAGLSIRSLHSLSDLVGSALPRLLDGVVRAPRSTDEERADAFETVVLDFGSSQGLALNVLGDGVSDEDLAELVGGSMTEDVDLDWTPVLVVSPRRAELRGLCRSIKALDEHAFYKRTKYVLNHCDADLGALLGSMGRVRGGDLTDTLVEANLSPLGKALTERGCTLAANTSCRWGFGAPFRNDGFSEISFLARHIVGK